MSHYCTSGQLISPSIGTRMLSMTKKLQLLSRRSLPSFGYVRRFGSACSRRLGSGTTRLLIAFLMLSFPCFGQSWSGILSPSRAIDWTHAGLPATLPDGETTSNPWTPPTRTQCVTAACNAVSGGTVTAASINAALASAPKGTYVLIPAGNFTLNSTNITMYAQNGVTLRGSGPQSTTLTLTGSSIIQMGGAYSSGSCTWVSGFSQGSTSLTMNGCSGPTPVAGQFFSLQQCDSGYSGAGCTTGASVDIGGLYVCGFNPACQRGGEGTGNLPTQTQIVYATSVTGNGTYTVNFTPGLYLVNWGTYNGSSNSPIVNWTGGASTIQAYGNGLEGMTIYSTGLTSDYPVDFNLSYASWVKGVRFIGSGTITPLYVNGDKNCLVMSNYLFSDIVLDANYPPAMQQGGDSDDLVINNFMTSGVPWEGTGSMQGDVVAYNYTRDTFTAYVIDIFEHNASGMMLLYEGNETPSFQDDDTHGSHNLNTWFRNYISGWEAPYSTPDYAGITWDSFARFENAVGNSIGTAGILANYQATQGNSLPNFVFSLDSHSSAHNDPLVLASALRWGNCDTVNGSCRFQSSEIPTALTGNAAPFVNSVPASKTLPCSFFLTGYTSTSCGAHPSGGTGLGWWKVCTSWTTFPTSCATTQTQPFPFAGPDVTGGPYVNGYAYDNPASIAFKNLPVDPAYQNSYTITASSWSGGVETLTISGLPNVTHLMGPFQISGGACSTSGMPNGEAYMTGSSSTQITYALASNPGSCTGTFKFPDVRQFDERVYMADGSAAGGPPPPAPPTGVTATVN
jgi:hypothetical protein